MVQIPGVSESVKTVYETEWNKLKKWLLLALLLFIGGVGAEQLFERYSRPLSEGAIVPYLQMVGESRATIRWLSGESYIGKLQYGEGSRITQEVVEESSRKRHKVTLSGLKSDTRYSYRISDDGEDGAIYTFVTAPISGSLRPLRLWIQGDPGYYRAETRKVVMEAMRWMEENVRPGLPLFDLWISTGDSAYPSGSRSDYQRELFNAYPALLPHYPYIPVYGNHDARNNQFFKLFTLPKGGELGGEPSGTEHYFSQNSGELHLIFLDSTSQKLTNDAEMARWLRADLRSNQQRWTLVFFHHPPYTKGSHDSDSFIDSGGRMADIRKEIVPILEMGGVDMVISGHSHVYERSFQLKGHYGPSHTLREEMVVDRDNCSERGAGTHYLVVGASAKQGGGELNHPAMALATREMGSLVIDINHDEIRTRYIDMAGGVLDQFSIKAPDDGGAGCTVD